MCIIARSPLLLCRLRYVYVYSNPMAKRGPKANPDIEKVIKVHARGMPIEEAWKRNGCPTTLGNVLRILLRHA